MSLLLPYQARWLRDKSRYKIGMFARQTGKTFTATLEIVLDMVAAEMRGRASRWVILSRGERQAREAMENGVKRHLRALEEYFSGLGLDLRERLDARALEVSLSHGSRVAALPANPDTARGFSANVFLDEFAFHQDSRKIWAALFPVVSRSSLRLRVASTPNGQANMFYELMTSDRYAAWSRHVVDLHQAIAQGLRRDLDDLRKGCGDADAWAREYELEWRDEASAWLPYELIAAREGEEAGKPWLYAGGPAYAGCDIGRRRDLFVIWVLEDMGDVAITREIAALRGVSFAGQDRELERIMSRYRVRRLCMDQSGMGEKPVEDAQARYGKSRVEGVRFGAESKLALASLGKAAFEEGRILIPANDPELRADLHKLRRESSPTGNPRFVADSDAAGHADRAWACFLALMAMDRPKTAYAYEPAPGRRQPDMDNNFSRRSW